MKKAQLSINTVIMVIIALVVLAAVVLFFTGQFADSSAATAANAAYKLGSCSTIPDSTSHVVTQKYKTDVGDACTVSDTVACVYYQEETSVATFSPTSTKSAEGKNENYVSIYSSGTAGMICNQYSSTDITVLSELTASGVWFPGSCADQGYGSAVFPMHYSYDSGTLAGDETKAYNWG